jgi:hypothetical protein
MDSEPKPDLKWSELEYVGPTLRERERNNVVFDDSKYFIECQFIDGAEKLQYIRFQNYYAATLTIKQRFPRNTQRGTTRYKWKTILHEYTLMKFPHYEEEAESWHLINSRDVF